MGMGLWVAGSSPLTVGGNCVNIVKAKTKNDDDNEVVDDDNDTNEGTREGKCGKLALGGRHEIGTQLFHFASVFVFVCGRVSNISVCVRVSMFFCVSVCVCVCVR